MKNLGKYLNKEKLLAKQKNQVISGSFENIARLVREKRKFKKLSQSDLSKELGFKNAQFISNIERGVCSIPIAKISKLSEALDVHHEVIREAIVQDFALKVYGK